MEDRTGAVNKNHSHSDWNFKLMKKAVGKLLDRRISSVLCAYNIQYLVLFSVIKLL